MEHGENPNKRLKKNKTEEDLEVKKTKNPVQCDLCLQWYSSMEGFRRHRSKKRCPVLKARVWQKTNISTNSKISANSKTILLLALILQVSEL